mmetsp:Transcript_21730/g.10169  ORF Transcript_21730/g.10169 Transcript_21730/m.10169 type:complete len:298 (-) Transcript_21730:1084-1977(-)
MTKIEQKIGRNEPCPCGSGKKYKRCCLGRKKRNNDYAKLKKKYADVYNIHLKEEKDIEGIKKAGKLVVKTLDLVESEIKPGISTDYINKIVHDFTIKNNALPAPLNYRGFPKSICVSVNDVICHGISDSTILREEDIVNVDVTTILDGYYADASKTFFAGRPKSDAIKIVEVARQSLKQARDMIKQGNTTGDLGWAIQRYAEKHKCSVVRELAGHGTGFDFHENPQILHFGKRATGIPLIAGMVFTIEPMINLGEKELYILDDGWTAKTKDGSLSAQFEQTFLVTKDGYEVLTPYKL